MATCSAEPISDDVYEKRTESTDPQTKTERLEITRKRLSNQYGADPTLDLFMLDETGWGAKLQLHYLLTVGRENLNNRERPKIEELVKTSAGNGLWEPDIARNSKTLKVAVLDWLQVPQLLELAGTDQVIHKDYPLVASILETAQSNTKAVKLALEITVTERTNPVSLVRNLLSKVGFKLRKVGTTGPRGARSRTYQVEQVDKTVFKLGTENDPIIHEYSYSREAIFEHWLAQDELITAIVKVEAVEATKTPIQQEPEPVCTGNNVCSSGNTISITTPSAYIIPPDKGQAGEGQKSPAKLTQIEQICLDILQTCDHWGQYLSVQTQIGAQRAGQLWEKLTGQQQQSIRDMEPQGGML